MLHSVVAFWLYVLLCYDYISSSISDPEMKKIIDKLAQFVARNGPEFENMTKQKQKDNPQFGFLFGGLHYNYYQYRVTTEQISKWLNSCRGFHCNIVRNCVRGKVVWWSNYHIRLNVGT